jgi:hypothetical protein|tara:strand:+ start:104 stop:349 length:246 start_codon:yes stop_codon:yes gene_type:complete
MALISPDDAAMAADGKAVLNAPDLEHESDDSGHPPINLIIGLAFDLVDDVVNQNRQLKRPTDCLKQPPRQPQCHGVWKARL